VRLIVDGRVEREIDAPDGLPLPDGPGIRTLAVDGSEYRSLAREIEPGALIEAGADLSESQARVSELRDRLLLIGLAGMMLVAALSWWLAGLALRPLARLREAGSVGGTEDLSRRLDPGTGASEIEALTASINGMLARLQVSSQQTSEALEATRRFAADAGHELRTPMTSLQANIGTLRRNPGIEPVEREAALEQMEREAARMMRLLGTLQALARGDSAAALPREEVDLTAIVGAAVESAARRHPGVTWTFEAPDDEVMLAGWPDGLAAMADNLLENAGRHGRPDGTVVATVSRDRSGRVSLVVEDDGPGIPEDVREDIFERFERGDTAGPGGSGLGLALVRQQAGLHGGEVSVDRSPTGGARFRVVLDPGRAGSPAVTGPA
jgi:signal transduction histidine kinase